MNEEELNELAKKFGDNYTYGKIKQVLKEKFIEMENCGNCRYLSNCQFEECKHRHVSDWESRQDKK